MNTIIQIISNMGQGIIADLNLFTLLMILVGSIVGMVCAAVPGLTLITGVILALPFTYAMDSTNAIILLTSIYLAGTYGGAFPAILFKIPGDPIHVPLLWDGYPMARQGLAAKALGWTLVATVAGGLFSIILLVLVSAPLAQVALKFSSPEYFAIVFLGLTSVLFLGNVSLRHSIVSLALGLLIATVGVEGMFGVDRFTFGTPLLRGGIDYLNVLIGVYAVAEIFARLEFGFSAPSLDTASTATTTLPSFKELRPRLGTYLRSGIIGTFIGFVPGAGATIASFIGYGIEQQVGPNKKEMGKGAPEGILASQTAATASVGGALIPLLTMGIPGSGATAIILGAFLLHGIQPGPAIFLNNGPLIYAIYGSLFICVIMMIFLGFLSVRPLMKILQAPEAVTSSFILVLCMLGAYALRSNLQDVWMLLIFGVVGYFLNRFDYPTTPLVLGVILGPLAESSFLTTMISFKNDWTVLFTRPVSAVFMTVSILSLVVAILLPMWNKYKERKLNKAHSDQLP
ncbi:tripartite tricarboxylate transporter permease [Desulfosporosinus fructosivorans]|nr:tripartite tricarboxylate transporter permease [Desulfosporosinus fructosivorans]